MKKFIHICPDEKFISAAISQFLDVDKENHYFIVVSHKKELTFLKDRNQKIVTPAKLYLFIINNLNNLKDKTIILHSAKKFSKISTLLAPSKCKIVWIGFGYDYYNNHMNKGFIKRYLEKKFLKRIDFFSPVLLNEYEIVKKTHPYFIPKLLDWNYDVVSFFWNMPIPNIQDSILLGNSATDTNNHLEIINLLEKIKIESEVIVPLSYGNLAYKESILNLIKESPINMKPLINYMAIEDYYKIISICSHVIMNHSRQQAYGNIMISLYSGSKLFLKKENPLYENLIESGFILYTIEDIQNEIKSRLDTDAVIHNRNLALSLYSRNEFLNRTQRFIETIYKNE